MSMALLMAWNMLSFRVWSAIGSEGDREAADTSTVHEPWEGLQDGLGCGEEEARMSAGLR